MKMSKLNGIHLTGKNVKLTDDSFDTHFDCVNQDVLINSDTKTCFNLIFRIWILRVLRLRIGVLEFV